MHAEPRTRLPSAARGPLGLAACATMALAGCTADMNGLEKSSQVLPSPEARGSTLELQGGQGQQTREDNPFGGARFHVDATYTQRVTSTASGYPALAPQIKKASVQPTAVWIDAIARVGRVSETLAAAAAEETSHGGPRVVSVFVLYDLPNRDCAARSSSGELSVDDGGEARYRAEFIDPIAAAIAARPSQRVVALVEPDSLANLATNAQIPRCAAAGGAYRRGTAYAISKLSSLPNVTVYLDAAHAGWLGWAPNRTKIVDIYKDVLDQAGGADKIRGFFTNVSNYNVLHGDDGRRLEPSTPCPDELTYVAQLRESLAAVGIVGEGFVVDTSRNGRAGIRSSWGHWCNVAGAGLGERPRAAPEPGIDAYFWVKPPGESDGTSDSSSTRFDPECGSKDAAQGAPAAGQWFPAYFADLVRNANPPF